MIVNRIQRVTLQLTDNLTLTIRQDETYGMETDGLAYVVVTDRHGGLVADPDSALDGWAFYELLVDVMQSEGRA